MKILIPSFRNPKILPPLINWVNFLSSEQINTTVVAYYLNQESFAKSESLSTISISDQEYPKSFRERLWAKIKGHTFFYFYLAKNVKDFDLIWIGVWDYPFIDFLARFWGFKGKIIYQFHELEFHKMKYCRKADFCIIPEENRLWITYFLGKLNTKPLLLPNIPSVLPDPDVEVPSELIALKTGDTKLLLYQGLIDFKKRCLEELLTALTTLPSHIQLVVMPMPNTPSSALDLLRTACLTKQLQNRVHILDPQTPPTHLNYIKFVDLGVGLYRPTSLNQIYAAPNRLYEFTAFGIPLILPNFPSFNALQHKYVNAIITVSPEDPEDIASGIASILLDEKKLAIGKKNASLFFAREANYHSFAKKVLNKISQ